MPFHPVKQVAEDKTTRWNVASGVPPDVEGGILPAGRALERFDAFLVTIPQSAGRDAPAPQQAGRLPPPVMSAGIAGNSRIIC
jgi:hypothetical protein